MSKNIWYISKYIAPSYAAKVGARGFLLLKEFSALGHQSTLITSDSNHLVNAPKFTGKVLNERISGVDVYWLKTLKYQGARSFGRMLSWVDFEWQLLRFSMKKHASPDVVIVSSLSLLTVLTGFYLRWKYKCKLVFEVRDIWPLVLTESGGISEKNPFVLFLGWVEKLGYKYSDLIVGTMPNLQAHVLNVLGEPRDVLCIPQGIDEEVFSNSKPLDDDYISSYIPSEKFIVCHAGSIGADNALETFFSCARAMQSYINIHFLIVGDGYLKEKYISENNDLSNLTFAPAIPKSSVQSLLSLVDVVYFAAHKSVLLRYGQSLNKVIDYMYSSKPIVASYSGYPSMINEADCGSFVPAEDVEALKSEIVRLSLMSDDERAIIGARGKDWLLANRKYNKLAVDYLNKLNSI